MSSATSCGAAFCFFGGRAGPSGLADRVGQSHQVVLAWRLRSRSPGESDDLPAARGTKAIGVRLAQVIGMRLDVRRQRAEHRGGVGVVVGQGRNR